jgi:hypothetical protein
MMNPTSKNLRHIYRNKYLLTTSGADLLIWITIMFPGLPDDLVGKKTT